MPNREYSKCLTAGYLSAPEASRTPTLLGIYFTMLFSITVFSIELCTNYGYTVHGSTCMKDLMLVTILLCSSYNSKKVNFGLLLSLSVGLYSPHSTIPFEAQRR